MFNVIGKIFSTQNDKIVKQYAKRVQKVSVLESKYKQMSDEELQNTFLALKEDIVSNKKVLNDIIYDVFAIAREASLRILNMRHFDVQLIDGMILSTMIIGLKL